MISIKLSNYIRKSNLSLDQIAHLVDLPSNLLSDIKEGQANPSINDGLKISRFIDTDEQHQALFLKKAPSMPPNEHEIDILNAYLDVCNHLNY